MANSGPVQWESDSINSNTHLGINDAVEDTLELLHTLSCVSMSLGGRVEVENSTGVYRYLYGSTTIDNVTLPYTTTYNSSLASLGTGYQILSVTHRLPFSSITDLSSAP
jgi:hypothetical protein